MTDRQKLAALLQKRSSDDGFLERPQADPGVARQRLGVPVAIAAQAAVGMPSKDAVQAGVPGWLALPGGASTALAMDVFLT